MISNKGFSVAWMDSEKFRFRSKVNGYIVAKVEPKGNTIQFWATPIVLINQQETLKQIYSKCTRNTVRLYVGKDVERSMEIKSGDKIKGVIVKQTSGGNAGKNLLVWCFENEEFVAPAVGDHNIYVWDFKPKPRKQETIPQSTMLTQKVMDASVSSITFESLFEDDFEVKDAQARAQPRAARERCRVRSRRHPRPLPAVVAGRMK